MLLDSPVMVFPVMYGGYKLVKRTHFVRASEMDFVSGIAQIESECYEEPVPKNFGQKVWNWIM